MLKIFKSKTHSQKLDMSNIPNHVAVIMDGNGRWAKKRGLPRSAGHVVGAKNLEKIIQYAGDIGIKNITLYCFSTENWKRPKDEVDALMRLFVQYMHDYDKLMGDKKARVRFLGTREGIDPEICDLMEEVEKKSEMNDELNVNLCLNYGGREELVNAVRLIAEDVASGKIDPDAITEKDINDRLYTSFAPDPDLIIRPSGELRLSNFLLWQCAYSEFWFSDILWPDFVPKKMEKAIIDFQQRNRRFGGV